MTGAVTEHRQGFMVAPEMGESVRPHERRFGLDARVADGPRARFAGRLGARFADGPRARCRRRLGARCRSRLGETYREGPVLPFGRPLPGLQQQGGLGYRSGLEPPADDASRFVANRPVASNPSASLRHSSVTRVAGSPARITSP